MKGWKDNYLEAPLLITHDQEAEEAGESQFGKLQH